MNYKKIKIVFIPVLIMMLTAVLYGGTTGKISGKVVDQATGEPMPGANIMVIGTDLGAATDMNGNYSILQVPPGVHSVSASVIGYAKSVATEIRVRIDQTARVDFELSMEALQGETVTVFGNKNIVKRDVATSVSAFSTQEVAEMAVNNVDEVVELQAGVEDGLMIRGGDANQALFQIDGITMRDPRNNQPITGIAMNAIQEISVERGGFNAEYGQVRSGLINTITKEGSKQAYHGAISVKASPPEAKHFGVSPFDANSMWNRPYLDDAVCWTGTQSGAWDEYTARQYPEFRGWNQISYELLTDQNPDNDLSPVAAQKLYKFEHRKTAVNDQPDYNIDVGFGGPVPLVGKALGDLRFFASYQQEREMLLIPLTRDDYLNTNYSLQLVSDISPAMKLTVTGLMGKNYNVAINDGDEIYLTNEFGPNDSRPYILWTPTTYIRSPEEIAKASSEERPGRIFSDGWYNDAAVSHKSLGVKLTHNLNPKTYYDLRLEYISRSYETGPIPERDYTPDNQIIPGFYVDDAPFGWSPISQGGIGGGIRFFGGHTGEARDSSKVSSAKLKFDLTSQVNFSNLVKTGFELTYHDLNLNWGQINSFTSKNIFNRERNFPIQGAFYVQDKLEAKGFILNMGLRLDFSNANTEWVDISSDPFNPDFLSIYDPTEDYPTEKSKTKWSLSPRLGISHPITDNSKLFFNYGHFKQLPTYEELLRISRSVTGSMLNYGDPNLEMAKTVSYELGYDHHLFNSYLIQAAAFYHDITDQQAFTVYNSERNVVNYSANNNNGYEDVRGFELTLRKQSGKWFTGFANYTYQVNTYGFFGTRSVFDNPSDQKEYNQNTRNLYQGKPLPRPYARVSLVFRTPGDFGKKILGINPLNHWTMNVIYNWKAGDWIDWNPDNQMDIYDNIQVRSFSDFTLRLNKTFSVKKVSVTLFMDIQNLFNTKRLSGASFYNYFDYEYYMKSLHLPESDDWNNIVGNDRPGDYRKEGVAYQPIEQTADVLDEANPAEGVIYYERNWGRYMEYVDNSWVPVDKEKMNKVLDDKAYIDMPNQTSFNFLNPRQIFFGLKLSFDLD